ncbi:hypothetical protein M501DRAFT_987980 [Patellaria atrata CBS 101060]|uniref:RNA polymerase II subunit A C-terminal domain phosphatase n=1 Tax=Patellaria atrata CBS 101060 TaxID=1346257 RepID=A0A9P4S3K9_9PEZI|nr:hypothetical protein M501DRAFT_987980 [Patellaria atrata CBS 101060]
MRIFAVLMDYEIEKYREELTNLECVDLVEHVVGMLIKSPRNLHYPITVTELLKRPSDEVERFAPLFSYYYTSKVTERNEFGDESQVERKFPTKFECETNGTILNWKINAETVISAPGIPIVEVDEPCRHEIQFGGMCATCGKNMDEVNYATSVRDSARAPINMTHGHTALTVSHTEASRVEEEAKRRLLSNRRLSLVVDLDQTIIHATVDPTVAEWQKDEDNPNHDAVKDVRAFQLVDDGPGGRGCWYYIKLRPGLEEFLKNISKLYELHIYTMGTRAYAQNIAKIVDPDRKIFGDRILSRDESGSLQVKTLHRLFPVDTKMVVIIDDRGDVWNWSHNLIKVTAYDFFVGIGDINSSFLPKRDPLPPMLKPPVIELAPGHDRNQKPEGDGGSSIQTKEPQTTETTVPGVETPVSALEQQLVSMGGGSDPIVLEQQTTQQEEKITAQVTDRPLLKLQKKLDEADEEAAAMENGNNADEPSQDSHKHRHNLLQDHDNELAHLETNLRHIHEKFFEEYEKSLASSHGGRVAELRGEKAAKKRPVDDLELVPDVKDIMPSMKCEVLKNVSIVFSGLIPLGTNIQYADIAIWARSFGAEVTQDITRRTTHVVASKQRKTAKVKQAARRPRIKIVSLDWLLECFQTWRRPEEVLYEIEVHPDEAGPQIALASSPLEELQDGVVLSSSEDEAAINDETTAAPTPLSVITGDVNEAEDLMPTSPIDEKALRGTQEEWDSMNAEIDEMLAESGSDDDGGESDSSIGSSTSSKSNKKRKRGTDSGNSSAAEDSDSSVKSSQGSRLQRRKKRALERVTSLTNVTIAEKSTGLPSPDTTGPEDPQGVEAGDGEGDDLEDDEDFEAEMMAEFERDDDESDAG